GGGRSPAYLSLLTPSLTAKVRDARVPSCCDGKAAYRRRSPGRPGILPGQPFVLGMGRDPAQGGVRLHHVVPELHPLLLLRPALAGGPQQLQRTFLVSRALPPVLLRAGDEGIGPRRVVEQAVSRNLGGRRPQLEGLLGIDDCQPGLPELRLGVAAAAVG